MQNVSLNKSFLNTMLSSLQNCNLEKHKITNITVVITNITLKKITNMLMYLNVLETSICDKNITL
ncbi:hypothetical protein EHP00_1955 [Ecytonucleospora hepatopenaei]|uniref:Uncharacterized protein n=1 Tax=Ecytonucleospora hepatopenaei TaxID=646526 RepID=A0A1W0E8Q7_9MICR|nr:hypothetical protein EHP00_1955 [Ecytonucleospora hepatopenaei]